jgi:hypothetical protein
MKLAPGQVRLVKYSTELRDNKWYVVETSRLHGEFLRGPFKTKAAAEKRLQEYVPMPRLREPFTPR